MNICFVSISTKKDENEMEQQERQIDIIFVSCLQ